MRLRAKVVEFIVVRVERTMHADSCEHSASHNQISWHQAVCCVDILALGKFSHRMLAARDIADIFVIADNVQPE